MKVLWLTNIPSPYRVDFFNELGKDCDLTVLFERGASSERDASWENFQVKNFQAIFLKGKNIGAAEAFCPSVRKYLVKGKYDYIVVTNFSSLTGIWAICYMKRKGIPYIIEGDGAFAGSGKGIKEKVKKYLISNAELYFSTADEHDKYYLMYGASKEKIVRYPFSSVSEKYILEKALSNAEKLALRQELGIIEKKVILAVGQFIPRKGYDLLIQAMGDSSLRECGCYIIGGKAPQEYLDLQQEYGAENIHFIEFKKKDELKRYYQAADIFVHPTREDIWGLVINEAMAQGLPIISTNRCIAALELIENGKNGYIVPVGDIETLASKIEELLENESLRGLMSEESLRVIHEYTIEGMAKRHIEIFLMRRG